MLYITPALKKAYGAGYKEIAELAKLLGAKKVVSKPAKGLKPDMCIVMGLETEDEDALFLFEEGSTVYNKEILPMMILRRRLELDRGEFEIQPKAAKPAKKATKKGGRK
jgi:hypothetical protein